MKNLYLIILLVCTQIIYAQSSIFDVARSGTVDEVKMLMKADADVINQVNTNGHTPLILASYKGNTDVALFLIDHVKDLNTKSADGTALMAAVVSGNTDVAEALVNKKADLNVVDANGTTALLFATMFRNSDLVELLFYGGADVSLKDNKGKNALDYATLLKQEKLISLLKKKNL